MTDRVRIYRPPTKLQRTIGYFWPFCAGIGMIFGTIVLIAWLSS